MYLWRTGGTQGRQLSFMLHLNPTCRRDMADDTESGGDERIGNYAVAVAGAAVAAAARGGGAGPLVGVRCDDPVVSGAPRWSSETTALAVRAC